MGMRLDRDLQETAYGVNKQWFLEPEGSANGFQGFRKTTYNTWPP